MYHLLLLLLCLDARRMLSQLEGTIHHGEQGMALEAGLGCGGGVVRLIDYGWEDQREEEVLGFLSFALLAQDHSAWYDVATWRARPLHLHPFWKRRHRHSQRSASLMFWVFLNPVR